MHSLTYLSIIQNFHFKLPIRLPTFFNWHSTGISRFSAAIEVVMVKAQKFIYNTRFVGEPKLSDFTLEEEELPDLNDGG